MRAYPDAIVLLSVRDSEKWWKSASETIFAHTEHEDPNTPWAKMITAIMNNRFTIDLSNKEACIAGFEAHNARVKAGVPAERLVVWQASDGWEPICKALGLPIPAHSFPLTNTTKEFHSHTGIAGDKSH